MPLPIGGIACSLRGGGGGEGGETGINGKRAEACAGGRGVLRVLCCQKDQQARQHVHFSRHTMPSDTYKENSPDVRYGSREQQIPDPPAPCPKALGTKPSYEASKTPGKPTSFVSVVCSRTSDIGQEHAPLVPLQALRQEFPQGGQELPQVAIRDDPIRIFFSIVRVFVFCYEQGTRNVRAEGVSPAFQLTTWWREVRKG